MSASALVFGNPTTFSYQGISGSIAITGSLTTSGDLTVQGDATVAGTLTATEFHTQFVSASILFQSGSTKLGDTIDDTHQFTGSLSVSGSLSVNGAESITSTTVTTPDSYLRKQYVKSAASISVP